MEHGRRSCQADHANALRDVRSGSLRAGMSSASAMVSFPNVSLVLAPRARPPGRGRRPPRRSRRIVRGIVFNGSRRVRLDTAQQEAFAQGRASRRMLSFCAERPEFERRELEHIYTSRGLEPDVAEQLAKTLMSSPELALDTHAREELGIDPDSLGVPIKAGVSSFLTFAVGAFLPLIPFSRALRDPRP